MRSLVNTITEYIKQKKLFPKSVCLILAVVLWSYITTTKNGEMKFKVSVEVTHLPAYLTVSDMRDQTIDVVIEGKKELIKAVNTKTVRALVDLSQPRENISARYPVQIIRDQIPDSIRVIPSKRKIYCTVERKTEKIVRVVPRVVGNMPDGYIVGRFSVDPEYITISGAHRIVDTTEKIFTANIVVAGESGDIVREVEINRDNLKNVELSKNDVKVSIPLLKQSSLISVEVPISIRNTRRDYRYSLKKEKTVVYVRAAERDRISADQLLAFVDASKMVLRDPASKGRVPLKEEELDISVLFKDGSDPAGIFSNVPQRVVVKASAK